MITRRVLEEIKLVVLFRVDPFSSFGDLGNNLCPVRVEMFLLHLVGYLLGGIFLGG